MKAASYQNNTLAPTSSPVSSYKPNPVAGAPGTMITNRNLLIQLHADTEVEVESRCWELQRARDVAFRKGVLEVVCGNRIFDHVEVGVALEQMLALARRILRAHLLAVDALDRHALVTLVFVEFSRVIRLTLSSSLALNSTKAACTSSSAGAGMLDVLVLVLGVLAGLGVDCARTGPGVTWAICDCCGG